MNRRALTIATAGAIAAVAIPAAHGAGTAAPKAAAAQGTVSVTPSIMETTARRAASTSTVVRNTTNRALKFTVKPRPWRQSKSGAVRAVRSRTLRGVGLSAKRFKLGAGKSRRVYVTLGSVPSRGSLYGALDAVGKPKRGSGVNVAYRLVASTALQPVLEALPPARRDRERLARRARACSCATPATPPTRSAAVCGSPAAAARGTAPRRRCGSCPGSSCA